MDPVHRDDGCVVRERFELHLDVLQPAQGDRSAPRAGRHRDSRDSSLPPHSYTRTVEEGVEAEGLVYREGSSTVRSEILRHVLLHAEILPHSFKVFHFYPSTPSPPPSPVPAFPRSIRRPDDISIVTATKYAPRQPLDQPSHSAVRFAAIQCIPQSAALSDENYQFLRPRQRRGGGQWAASAMGRR